MQQRGLEFREAQRAARQKESLLERQFAASEDDRSQRNAALKELRNYNLHNIDQAPAGVLATIDNKTLSGLISAYTANSAKPSEVRKLPTADVQVMREIQQQQRDLSEKLGREVSIAETPMFQIIMAKKGQGKSPEEQRLQLTTALSKNIIYGKLVKDNPKEAARIVNELSRELGLEQVGTSASDTGGVQQSAIDRALEKFKARNRAAVQQ